MPARGKPAACRSISESDAQRQVDAIAEGLAGVIRYAHARGQELITSERFGPVCFARSRPDRAEPTQRLKRAKPFEAIEPSRSEPG